MVRSAVLDQLPCCLHALLLLPLLLLLKLELP